MAIRFLDTNLLLRYFTRDDEDKAARVLSLLQRVERGEERVATSPLVIFETIFTLQRSYKVSRDKIKELVEPVIALRGLQLPNKHIYYQALDLYTSIPKLSFADAYNASYMASLNMTEVYSFDTGFDDLPGINRFEPQD